MRVSTRGRYGLRAIVDLAINQDSGPTPLRVVSERTKISEQYLEQLFTNLRKSKIVKSVRGAHGGYLLNNPPEDIAVKDVIEALEGPLAPSDCVLNRVCCDINSDCVTHNLWVDVKEKIDNYLNSISIADLIERYHNLSN